MGLEVEEEKLEELLGVVVTELGRLVTVQLATSQRS